MKSQFVKFIIVIISFFGLLIIADRIVVRIEDRLYSTKDNKINYAAYSKDVKDIVILGSSRASHHYVPQIIEDSLGMSCMNLGTDGQGILYNYSLFHMLIQNNTPKVVIYEFGGFDWEEEGESTFSRLEALAPVYGQYDAVDSLINRVSPKYPKLISILNTYRYNTRIHNVFVKTHQTSNRNGYLPLYGTNNGFVIDNKENTSTISEIKVKYIMRLIKECKENNVLLVFATSPSLKHSKNLQAREIMESLLDDNEHFLDYLNITNDRNLFKDATHMNNDGAGWYTSLFARDLKKILNGGKNEINRTDFLNE